MIRIFKPMFLSLTLMTFLAGGVAAQETSTAAETASETAQTEVTATTATSTPAETAEQTSSRSPERVRQEFRSLLNRHPSEVSRVLGLDPALLNNEAFLARYPDVADFVAKHPEIRRNPHYHVADFEYFQPQPRSAFDEAIEMMGIIAVISVIAFALAWIIRTTIEQRRWNRLSRTQSEVHNKILDRFGTSQEVLDYIKSPAGSKFLESAPIPVRAEQMVAVNTPMPRILWSIQLGVVIAAGGVGMLLVSLRFAGETAEGFFALGAIALCLGAGFIASAVVSIAMTRRLGLWQDRGAAPTSSLDESGLMR